MSNLLEMLNEIERADDTSIYKFIDFRNEIIISLKHKHTFLMGN